MAFRAAITIGYCAFLLASAATAQPQSAIQLKAVAPSPDIVVTAKPEPTSKEVKDQATSISHMGDFYHDPLARFSDRICPGVLGLPADAAGIVVDRIRYDAERVGAPLERSTNCKANILVVFTRDSSEEVRKVLKKAGYLFDSLEGSEARELRDEEGPAHAWSVTEQHNRYGQQKSPTLSPLGVQWGEDPALPSNMTVITAPTSDSRLFLAHRLDILASVVVIDLKAIDGLPVAQIADYAAMRALARTRPASGESAASTILSLFDPKSEHPPEMTRFDLAYLRTLYDAGSNVPASVKILNVARTLEKDGVEASKAAKPAH